MPVPLHRVHENGRQRFQALAADPVRCLPEHDQHLAERLTVAYLVSAGSLDGGFRADSAEDPESTMQNTWYPPATAGEVRVWAYGNDGRGGFDWTMRTIVVR